MFIKVMPMCAKVGLVVSEPWQSLGTKDPPTCFSVIVSDIITHLPVVFI